MSEKALTADETGLTKTTLRPKRLPVLSAASAGYGAVLLSVLFNGSAYHFQKAALHDCPPALAVCLSAFLAALILLTLAALARFVQCRSKSPLRAGDGIASVNAVAVFNCLHANWKALWSAALLGAAGSYLILFTVRDYGPTVAAFLANLTLVFMVLGGLLRGERLERREFPVIALVIGGAFLFAYRGNAVQWGALLMMLGATLFTAGKQLLIKHVTEEQRLLTVMAAAQIMMGIWSAILALSLGDFGWPGWNALGFLCMAALCGNTLGMALLYSGYKRVGVARGAPLDALRPLAVLFIGLALGSAHSSAANFGAAQIAGGLLVLLGSIALAAWRGTTKLPRSSASP